MGLPEILIEFRTKGTSAIQRSGKGIVAMILKDDTKAFDTKIYKPIEEVESTDWTAENKDYIDKVFMGTPLNFVPKSSLICLDIISAYFLPLLELK